MKSQQAHRLCIKSLTGQLSETEAEAMKQWLDQSESNRIHFADLKKTWDETTPPILDVKPDMDQAWSRIEKDLFQQARQTGQTPKREAEYHRNILWGLRPAWAVFALVMMVMAATVIWKTIVSPSLMQTVSTANGEIHELVLSDGTQVRLNSGSSISYRRRFESDQRNVHLSGEAYFVVAHDARSFSVITDQAVTTVTGTQFNVWAREKETRVIVREGSIDLKSRYDSEHVVTLSRGQTSRVVSNQAPQPPRPIDTDYLPGWINGQLVFEKTPVPEIISELERTYDVSIAVIDSSLQRRTVTAEFRKGPFENILSSLCLTLGAQYHMQSGMVIISK